MATSLPFRKAEQPFGLPFCKELKNYFEHYFISCEGKKTSFEPPSSLSLSEIMTICVCFHLSGYRTFKWYYTKLIQKEYSKFFPCLVSYNRFVGLMPYAALPLSLFVRCIGFKTSCTGISFVDSTTLDVCDSHRIQHLQVLRKEERVLRDGFMVSNSTL